MATTNLQVDKTQPRPRQARAVVESPKVDMRCGECGYGAVVSRMPARCPMCGCQAWEHAPWRPFARHG